VILVYHLACKGIHPKWGHVCIPHNDTIQTNPIIVMIKNIRDWRLRGQTMSVKEEWRQLCGGW